MPNRLINETSPYLLQHAHNPVDWYPWGAEAFEKAAAEDKPVLVSIGYAACHWCHVMEHESFEDEQAARLMNELLVAIKVDREERPGYRQHLHERCSADAWTRRLAAQRVPDAGRASILRRHVFPADRPQRDAVVVEGRCCGGRRLHAAAQPTFWRTRAC